MQGNVGRRPEKTLWRELSDGSAGAIVRILVSLAAGLFLFGVACASAYLLCMLFAELDGSPGRSGARPFARVDDEVAVVCFLGASASYIATLLWIWSRHRSKRGIWLAGAMTVGTWGIAILASLAIDELFRGDQEFLVTGVCCVAGAVTLLLWLRVWRQYVGGRLLYGEDGRLDVRCPQCGYRLVGLSEARCPECGQQYTVDELLAKQDFEALRPKRVVSMPGANDENGPNQPRLGPPAISPQDGTALQGTRHDRR